MNKSYDKSLPTIGKRACNKVSLIIKPKETHGTLLGSVSTPIKTLNVFIQ